MASIWTKQPATQFLTSNTHYYKFDGDLDELEGTAGIGCISDNEPQPLLVQSHLGSFAVTTVGKINIMNELVDISYKNDKCAFFWK